MPTENHYLTSTGMTLLHRHLNITVGSLHDGDPKATFEALKYTCTVLRIDNDKIKKIETSLKEIEAQEPKHLFNKVNIHKKQDKYLIGANAELYEIIAKHLDEHHYIEHKSSEPQTNNPYFATEPEQQPP